MNYYTFKPIPELNFETFYEDIYWKNSIATSIYINAMMVKFILGYKNVENWFSVINTGTWFER